MTKMTITEALSEINLIKKKLEHKKTAMQTLLIKADHVKDIYESEGGVTKHLQKEFQALSDLRRRFVSLRAAISEANLNHEITVGEKTLSIHDWLTWKREIAKEEQNHANYIVTTVNNYMTQSSKNPQCYDDAEGKKHLVTFTPTVDLAEWVKKQERLNDLLENLDGQLSLKNATILVSIK